MLFSAFDWDRVLIYGAIGAGVGLLVALIRLAFGVDKPKKNKDDEDR